MLNDTTTGCRGRGGIVRLDLSGIASTNRIRVLPCDDHDLVLRGLRALLEADLAMDVVGEASSADAGVTAAATTPDVVVMDVRMLGRSGIEACRDIRTHAGLVLGIGVAGDPPAGAPTLVARHLDDEQTPALSRFREVPMLRGGSVVGAASDRLFRVRAGSGLIDAAGRVWLASQRR